MMVALALRLEKSRLSCGDCVAEWEQRQRRRAGPQTQQRRDAETQRHRNTAQRRRDTDTETHRGVQAVQLSRQCAVCLDLRRFDE